MKDEGDLITIVLTILVILIIGLLAYTGQNGEITGKVITPATCSGAFPNCESGYGCTGGSECKNIGSACECVIEEEPTTGGGGGPKNIAGIGPTHKLVVTHVESDGSIIIG